MPSVTKVDGNTFDADEYNPLGIIHRKQFSDATERTSTSGSFEDSGTAFTLSVPVNSLVIGFFVKMDIKSSSGTGNADVKLSGTNLGAIYLIATSNWHDNASKTATIDSTENPLVNNNTSSYEKTAASGFTPLKILDATTTLTVRINATGTTSLKNVIIDVVYVESFIED